MFYQELFVYLAEKSGVPLWLVDRGGGVLYSTIETECLRPQGHLAEFFTSLAGEALETPQVRKLGAGELYGSIRFMHETRDCVLVAGPAYEIHPFSARNKGSIGFLLKSEYLQRQLLRMPVVSLPEFCRLLSVLALVFTKCRYAPEKLAEGIEDFSLREVVNKELVAAIFDLREEERVTAYAPDLEKKLLGYVSGGDIEAVRSFKMPLVKDRNAQDTKNQNLFEAVALVTLATRAAIAGGLDSIEAFSLSDLYFKRLSMVTGEKMLAEISAQILPHFTQKVHDLIHRDDRRVTSPHITKSIQYIRTHLHYHIRLEDVAREVGFNPKYLSHLFVTCLGEKFSSFVQRERIMEAKNLLENTDLSIIDICNNLGFSSQSYFIKVFQRYTGVTPGRFLEMKSRT